MRNLSLKAFVCLFVLPPVFFLLFTKGIALTICSDYIYI